MLNEIKLLTSTNLNTSFKAVFDQYNWEDVKRKILDKQSNDVVNALNKSGTLDIEDFLALISPSAMPFLEQMAQKSRQITRKRFGNTIQMYIPLYLSNECQNICTYCGFSFTNKIPRITLSDEEILKEARIIKQMGFDHILLVTGEANQTVGVEYLKNAIELLKPFFSNISIEVQPLEQQEYETLRSEGLHAVLVYQETYNEENYKLHHPKGKKSNFEYRLDTPDRLAASGIHKIGLGVLIGLEDWRVDSFFTALHLTYLEKKYWRSKYSISFPRLRPFSGGLEPKVVMNDKELLQLICAYRIFNEHVELSLSTRESMLFRDNVIPLGITTISAGSKTEPGGYANESEHLKQFEISDERSASDMAALIQSKGLVPVWKDWDNYLV